MSLLCTSDRQVAAVLAPLTFADRMRVIAHPNENGSYGLAVPDDLMARLAAAVAAFDAAKDAVAQLAAYAAAKRYAVETGGITVNGAPIATDRESQAMIANAYAYVQASGAATVSYKTSAGFATLAADQIKAVALAVGAHVQACFKAEDEVDAAVNTSPPTISAPDQVDAVFAALPTLAVSAPVPASSSAAASAPAAA